jgi:hypothetical protein
MVRAYLGRTPTWTERIPAQRAAHRLHELGLVTLERVPGKSGPPRLLLTKVPGAVAYPRPLIRWVRDGDGASLADAELSHAEWLDLAWQAFASDPGYAAEMAEAARRLGREVGSMDRARGAEARRARVEVRDVGLKVRRLSDFDGAWCAEGDPGQIGVSASHPEVPGRYSPSRG